MKRLVLLGSTGSIGRQTLEVVRKQREEFQVLGLSAFGNAELLAQQVSEFEPRYACLDHAPDVHRLEFSSGLLLGADGLTELVTVPDADLIVIAIPGLASLRPTLAAIRAKKAVALASKEALFVAGQLVMQEARKYRVPIFPVDSEPSAVWQCLIGENVSESTHEEWIHDVLARIPVKRLVLTASGGAFRNLRYEELHDVTPDMAINHPTWKMGTKVTVDSATMLNKGMEVVEAHWLFGIDWDRLDAVIHPESVVHSMVEFIDGSVKAQLSTPDMRLFIQYALNSMTRTDRLVKKLDILATSTLSFQKIDRERYPCFSLAVEAGKAGGTYTTVVNALDEELIRLFMQRIIRFDEICALMKSIIDTHDSREIVSIEDVENADEWTRRRLNYLINKKS